MQIPMNYHDRRGCVQKQRRHTIVKYEFGLCNAYRKNGSIGVQQMTIITNTRFEKYPRCLPYETKYKTIEI